VQQREARAGVGELRVRFSADPASVRGARRFVADGLRDWGMTDLLDDATLCVSELAGNAALHSGSTFMEIAMRSLEDAVRIIVEDDGLVPAESVGPLQGTPGPDSHRGDVPEEHPTTGRGLAIVSILASDWGIEQTDTGKRVWADIGGADDHPQPPARDEGAEQVPAVLPEGWRVVRLLGCPVQLSLRQDEHLDELVREFQLLAADRDNPRSLALAAEIEGLLNGPAHARHTGRRIAQQAAAAGQEVIDVDMAMPAGFSGEVIALQEAVRAADVLCEEMELLTLASSPELRTLRAWMTDQVVSQLDRHAAPVSWQDWLARHS
jgi:anti-sigma regulatory factor (Ser/Thr protein kinase)